MEHIHEPYLDGLIDGLLKLTRKHLVMCICVCRLPSDEWEHVLGTQVPLERAWIAVAGHVTLHPHAWWCERFERHAAYYGLYINWKAMHKLAQFMALHPSLRTIDSWCPANILILSRD